MRTLRTLNTLRPQRKLRHLGHFRPRHQPHPKNRSTVEEPDVQRTQFKPTSAGGGAPVGEQQLYPWMVK